MIKEIIFDFDGVIHDTFEENYKINVELNHGISREEYKSWFDGKLRWRRIFKPI